MKLSILLQYITPPRGSLVLSLALMLGGAFIVLVNPLLAGELTRSLLASPGKTAYTIPVIILLWGSLIVLRTLLNFANTYYMGTISESMATSLRNRVYEHMQALPLTWHQSRRRGEVLTIMTSDADAVSGFVTDTLLPLLPLGITLIGAFLMMARLDPTIGVLIIVSLPVYILILRVIGRQIRPLSRAWMDQYSALVGRVEENLSLLPAIKSFGRESLEKSRFRDENQQLLNLWRRQLRIQAVLSPAVEILAGLGLLIMLWLGSSHIEQGLLEPAGLVSLLLYARLLVTPLQILAGVYGQVQRARGAAERLVDFFDERPEPMGTGGAPLPKAIGAISFEGVGFAYPDRDPILCGLELSIKAGETIAITGRNGEGKSTLAHLLMRFVDPTSGTIRIDGKDIATAELGSVREQVGLVAQHVLLLNGTIADNIAYGRPTASEQEIRDAARAAHATDFIEALPEGYNSIIGDEGIKLSGGQRQRLSLARTLLKDPPILILDEATAMFDPASEASFIDECHELLKQRTVILITHRPASLALADRVLKLENGRLEAA